MKEVCGIKKRVNYSNRMQSNRHLFSFKGHKIIINANELAAEPYINLSMELIEMPGSLVFSKQRCAN